MELGITIIYRINFNKCKSVNDITNMLILFNKKSTGNGPCELAKTKFTPNPFLSKQSDSDSSNFSLGKTLNLNYKIE